MIDEFLMTRAVDMLQLKKINHSIGTRLEALQFGKNIGELRLFLKDIDAIEKASTNGEVINDFDKGQERGADEKPS